MKNILLTVAVVLLTVLAMGSVQNAQAEPRHETPNMSMMQMQGDMMPFSIQYEEVPNGVRLTLTPKDPAKLEEFRAKVRQHAEQMKKGECSMMQEMMQGMMQWMKNSEPTPKPEPKLDEADHSAHHPTAK